MSGVRYIGDVGPNDIAVSHETLAGHPVVSEHRPLTCRWPAGRCPVGFIVFCHGLGSNGGEYAALSSHWARHGYLVIHPTFGDSISVVARAEPGLGLDPESDLTGWTSLPQARLRMHQILHTPAGWIERVGIVRACVDALGDIVAATCGGAHEPMPGAIGGHSFGAFTAQLLAGAEIDLPDEPARRFHDARFKAAMFLSAQGRDQQGLRDGSWDALDGAMLNVTGTLDQGAKGGDWRWKSEPFEFAPPGAKYLAVLDDADHFLGGFAERGPGKRVSAQREAVRQLTLAFLDAHLRDSDAALAWLAAVESRIGDCPLLFRRK